MAVTQYSDVGITSNPDPRPTFDSSTLVTPANAGDLNNRDITWNISGRLVRVFPRNPNPYTVDAVT